MKNWVLLRSRSFSVVKVLALSWGCPLRIHSLVLCFTWAINPWAVESLQGLRMQRVCVEVCMVFIIYKISAYLSQQLTRQSCHFPPHLGGSVLPKGLLWLFEMLYGSSYCFYFWDVVFLFQGGFKLEILLSAGIIGTCHRAKGLCVRIIKILVSRLWDGIRRCHWCLKVAARYLLSNYVSLFLSL